MKTNLGVIFIICCIFFGVGGYFYSLLEGRDLCVSKGGTYLQGFYKMECIHQASAAIKDHGSSCHPHRVIEQKDMSAIYDRSHLGGK